MQCADRSEKGGYEKLKKMYNSQYEQEEKVVSRSAMEFLFDGERPQGLSAAIAPVVRNFLHTAIRRTLLRYRNSQPGVSTARTNDNPNTTSLEHNLIQTLS
eukprot:1357835-Amorphochlora_amoeboformis.AAC.1